MLRKTGTLLAGAALCAGMLAACSVNTEESLTLKDSFSKTVRPGDTTEAADAVRKARNVGGRMETDTAYTDFYLVSDDTSIAKVVQERRLFGAGRGTTTFTAKDKASALVSPKYDFSVSGL